MNDRRWIVMRSSVFAAVLVAFITMGLDAQIIQPAQPQNQKPIELPDAELVKKEIAEARSLTGVKPPTGDMLKKPAGEVDGEVITLDELLDEVMIQYGAPYVPALTQQALMTMEVMKRGIEITDEEILEQVRYVKAKSPSKLSLKELLKNGRQGWETFEKSVRTAAAINKAVKADQGITTSGPPNQFLMQIWAGGIRKHYVMETKQENLPAGCFAMVKTTWSLARALQHVVEQRAAGTPYRMSKEPSGAGHEMLVFTPHDGGWPRIYIPNVKAKISQVVGDKIESSEMQAEDLLRIVVDGNGEMAERLLAFDAGSATPKLILPMVDVTKSVKKGMPGEKTNLAEAVDALLKQGLTVDRENRRIQPKDVDGPVYTLPDTVCESFTPPFKSRLIDLVAGLVESKRTAAPFLLLSRKGENGFYMLPPVPVEMKTLVDRTTVLAFSFGTLKLAQFEDALDSLARYRAVKKAFRGFLPGQPQTGEPNAPWGVITVDEKAVQERIAKERAKYEGTIFPWEMICQILGKTVPEEMRRFWIGNGIDQIIGTDVDKETLRKYFDDNVVNFGVATAEASHILIQKRDPKTGRINWDEARKLADKVLAMIRTGADFGAMAYKYSDDQATKDKDGDLGLFTLVSRYDYDLCKAVFAMDEGSICDEPVRTRLGYHIIQVRKKTPPDLTRYNWEQEGMEEKVREARQDERQECWLEENIDGKYELKSYLEELLG